MGHVLANHPKPHPGEETGRILAGVAGDVANQAIRLQGGAVGALAGLGELVARLALNALLVYPEQQEKEYEADHIGLFLMAEAGYDPEDAVRFWERVQNDPVFSGLPVEFLSTHPSSEGRLEALKEHLLEARRRYTQKYGSKRGKNRPKKDTTY